MVVVTSVDREVWLQDNLLAVLRDANGPMTTTEVGIKVGSRQICHDSPHAWCDRCETFHPGPVWRVYRPGDVRPSLKRAERAGKVRSTRHPAHRDLLWWLP